MSLLNRKRVVLAKIETTYGVDSTPTGSANAILLRNLSITPIESDFVGRDLVRPYMGNSEQLPVGIRVLCDFEVEMVGGGTAGVAPAFGPLLRACALAETLTAAAVTGTATAGAASTVTLAAGASAVDGFYNGMPIRITSGTGSGSSGVVVAYNGTSKLATVAHPWAVAPGASSGYSIDANARYRPISETIESVVIYFNVDGVRHIITGARGTVAMSMQVKDIPVFRFSFTGIFNAPTDTALPVPVYTGFPTPQPVTNTNTTPFSLHATSAVMSELSIDLANSIAHRTLVGGSEQVLITDRQPSGSVQIEAELVAFRNWWTIARDATLGALAITHGTVTGRRCILSSNTVQLTKPEYTELDGITMLNMGMTLVPSVGNDEINICFA